MSEQAVEQLALYAAEIFTDLCVTDPDVRRAVCEMVLNGDYMIDMAQCKFDVAQLAGLATDETLDKDNRPHLSIPVGMTESQLNDLKLRNPDYVLTANGDSPHAHAKACAQRFVDTNRLLRCPPEDTLSVLDIGGNYTMHPKLKKSYDVHCCTLKVGWKEHHRQTQRDVSVMQGAEEVSHCSDGVQNCGYMASYGICVHVLPEIDPDDWVGIFKRHQLTLVDSVHHHDDRFRLADKGFMPYPEMHWQKNGDGMVEFWFDNDSSLGYSHSLQFLLEYDHPWVRSEPGWEYVIFYSIRLNEHGTITSALSRLRKDTVCYAKLHDIMVYTGGEDDVMVPVPTYDESLGFAATNPLGYVTRYYPVPSAMYNWVFLKGVANDTSRPDKPVSREDLRQAARVYNQPRSLNTTLTTDRLVFSAEDCDRIADGIYIAVTMQVTYDKMLTHKFTGQLQRLQRKWGHESIIRLLARSVSLTAVLPFMLLADEANEYLDLVALMVRSKTYNAGYLLPPAHRIPYHSVGRVEVQSTGQHEVFTLQETTRDEQKPDMPSLDSVEVRKQYYELFKDHMPEDMRKTMETELFPDGVPNIEVKVEDVIPPVEDEEENGLPTRQETENHIAENRDTWERMMKEMHDNAPEETRRNPADVEIQEASSELVHSNDRNAVFEFALHCFDLHYCTMQKCLEWLRLHWLTDRPNVHRMREDNMTKELGAAFLAVEGGLVIGADDGVAYDRVIDPYTRVFLDVSRTKDGKMRVHGASAGVVYVLDMLRIFNSKRVGMVAMQVYEKGFDLSEVSFHLVDGIAGSGKTRELSNDMTIRDLFATGPRAAASNVRRWCLQQERFASMEVEVGKRYRTMDSHLLRKYPLFGDQLYIDEGLMMHDGCKCVFAVRSKAKDVKVSGDNRQIGMIDRGSGTGSLLYSKRKYWSSIKYLNVSDRMPADATWICKQLYPPWRQPLIKTRSPVLRSFRVIITPNPNDPVYKEPTPYATHLTFVQNDKSILVKWPGYIDGKDVPEGQVHSVRNPVRPVLSVHESQGETYPVTVAVRLGKFSNDIYNSKEHQYVSSSRHTLLHVVKSVSDSGQCGYVKLINRAMSVSDEELMSLMEPTPPDMLARLSETRQMVCEQYQIDEFVIV